MNKKNTETLRAAAPILYRDLHGDCTRTCMAFGFECGDGWFPLLLKGSRKIEKRIQKLIDERQIPRDELPVAAQVKEKFGTLRFYVDWHDEGIETIVDQMERESETTCETCGSREAKRRGGGWIYTACDTCEAKFEENRRKMNG